MSFLSVYVHIPYCQAKCPYCDFNSHAAQAWPEEAYVRALCRELRSYAADESFAGGTVQTLFFGGGTPSLFAPASIAAVVDQVAALWPVASDVEVTLEANPGTVTAPKLSGLRQAGIDRLSFGVQSFHAHHLQRLGRIHSGDQARQAVRMARDARFEDINVDLIYALPEQTLAEWRSDLDAAIDLATEHVSAYNLTYEEGTAFHQWRAQGRLQPLPEEIEVAMFEMTQERLGAAGLSHYEISNYARPGHECRHNLNYWRCGAYVGVGAGAHGHAPAGRTGARRWSNHKPPGRYLEEVARHGHGRAAEEQISEAQAQGEMMFLALRCRSGVCDDAFRSRFGRSIEAAFPHVANLRRDGLLAHEAKRWRLTDRGLLLADSVFATFL